MFSNNKTRCLIREMTNSGQNDRPCRMWRQRAALNTFLSFVSEFVSIKFVFDNPNAASSVSQICWIYFTCQSGKKSP